MSCKPIGSPFDDSVTGTFIAGIPEKYHNVYELKKNNVMRQKSDEQYETFGFYSFQQAPGLLPYGQIRPPSQHLDYSKILA
jgi:hypothetical protein